MVTKQVIEALRNEIAKGKSEKVLKNLLLSFETNAKEQERYADLLQYSANYQSNKRLYNNAMISQADFSVISARLTINLLNFLSEWAEYLDSFKSAKPPIKVPIFDANNLDPLLNYTEQKLINFNTNDNSTGDIPINTNENTTDSTTKNVVATVIPPIMEVNKEVECKVLIAANKVLIEKVVGKAEAVAYDYDVELTRISAVEFKVKGTDTTAFTIVSENAHSTQALQTGSATEWIWTVKPQKAGNFTFLIFVSAVFRVNGSDYSHDMRLEKEVLVKAIENSNENPSNLAKTSEKNAKTDVLNILFFCANPEDTARLRIGVEFDAITTEIAGATYRDNMNVVTPQLSTSIKSLLSAILRKKPTILHYAGHSSEEGIALESADGSTQLVTKLANLFAQARGLECLILNSCYSEALAPMIKARLPNLHLIVVNYLLAEDSALAFSTGFYIALGEGSSYQEAFESGKALVGASGKDEDVFVFL